MGGDLTALDSDSNNLGIYFILHGNLLSEILMLLPVLSSDHLTFAEGIEIVNDEQVAAPPSRPHGKQLACAGFGV